MGNFGHVESNQHALDVVVRLITFASLKFIGLIMMNAGGLQPKVAIIMGSRSDWPTLKHAADVLDKMGVAYKTAIISAHRTPARLIEFSKSAKDKGFKVIIAGAGGAAHLPGMAASMTSLPVLGVPVQTKTLSGFDSLLSIVQMPGGVPVGTLAIGSAGAKNAAIFAASILGLGDVELMTRLESYRNQVSKEVPFTVED